MQTNSCSTSAPNQMIPRPPTQGINRTTIILTINKLINDIAITTVIFNYLNPVDTYTHRWRGLTKKEPLNGEAKNPFCISPLPPHDPTRFMSPRPLQIAISFYKLGRFRDALTTIATGLQHIDRAHDQVIYIRLLNVRAFTYLALEEPRNALQDFNTILTDFPNHISILLKRAELYIRIGRYNNAVKDLLNIYQIDPYQLDNLVALAKIYIAQGCVALNKGTPDYLVKGQIRLEYAKLVIKEASVLGKKLSELNELNDQISNNLAKYRFSAYTSN